MQGAYVPGHHQDQLIQTLLVRLLKTHLFSLFQKLEGPPLVPPFCDPLAGLDRNQLANQPLEKEKYSGALLACMDMSVYVIASFAR